MCVILNIRLNTEIHMDFSLTEQTRFLQFTEYVVAISGKVKCINFCVAGSTEHSGNK